MSCITVSVACMESGAHGLNLVSGSGKHSPNLCQMPSELLLNRLLGYPALLRKVLVAEVAVATSMHVLDCELVGYG